MNQHREDQTAHGTSNPPMHAGDRGVLTGLSVLVGLVVEILEDGSIIDRGRVDATTADGAIIWLAQEGAIPRRLWEMFPPRTIKVEPSSQRSKYGTA